MVVLRQLEATDRKSPVAAIFHAEPSVGAPSIGADSSPPPPSSEADAAPLALWLCVDVGLSVGLALALGQGVLEAHSVGLL